MNTDKGRLFSVGTRKMARVTGVLLVILAVGIILANCGHEITPRDVLLRLDELPPGWFQAQFEEDLAAEYSIKTVQVIFVNEPYVDWEEKITISNYVSLCVEKEAAIYRLEKMVGGTNSQEIDLGDKGFFLKRGEQEIPSYEIYFAKGQYFVWIIYFGKPLSNVGDEENIRFVNDLAQKVAKRVPS